MKGKVGTERSGMRGRDGVEGIPDAKGLPIGSSPGRWLGTTPSRLCVQNAVSPFSLLGVD